MPQRSGTFSTQHWPVAVVGAGISGLACAHRLLRLGVDSVLLEAGDHVGGKIRTVREAGVTFEAGPNTLLLNKQPTVDLIGELGLSDALVHAAPAARKRWIWKDGRLCPLPGGLLSALVSPLVGPGAIARALGDLRRTPPHLVPRDETVAAFVTRRFGPRVLANLVEPFLAGVYAGDVQRMEAASVLGELVAAEQQAGSVIRGLLARRRAARRAGRPRLPLISATFEGGLATLANALADALGSHLLRATPVTRLACDDRAATLTLADGSTLTAGQVVLATESSAAASLLRTLPDGERPAGLLDQVESVRLAVVGLLVDRDAVPHPLDGFGFLVARPTDLNILGCIFRSAIFPFSAPAGQVLLVAFVGGAHAPELVDRDDAGLEALVRADLQRTIGLAGPTRRRFVSRWAAAIPHLTVGHQVRRASLLDWCGPRRLALIGPYVGGVSLNDCLALGRQRAEELARQVAQPRPKEA